MRRIQESTNIPYSWTTVSIFSFKRGLHKPDHIRQTADISSLGRLLGWASSWRYIATRVISRESRDRKRVTSACARSNRNHDLAITLYQRRGIILQTFQRPACAVLPAATTAFLRHPLASSSIQTSSEWTPTSIWRRLEVGFFPTHPFEMPRRKAFASLSRRY